MIVGDTGSGKSSLLYAILDEMIPDPSTKSSIHGTIGFCPQKPWIMAGTIKENIVFFSPFDKDKLEKVIYYSGL